MLSPLNVESDSTVLALKRRLETVNEEKVAASHFEDEAAVVLPGRLVESRLAYSTIGWRLALPKSIVELWGIRPGNNNATVLLAGGYIEIWSMEALKDAYSGSLWDLI